MDGGSGSLNGSECMILCALGGVSGVQDPPGLGPLESLLSSWSGWEWIDGLI